MPRLEPLGAPAGLAPRAACDDFEIESLPRDLPRWVKDAAAISQRARTLIAKAHPFVVRVITFWDHTVRGVRVGGRDVLIDASGSYRLE
ncbi:MAG TPA: hypothetical protein VFL13_05330 [Candidatus Baltobacteraceae bacterium]|nr:hypothetical protein [Candidatus Baltobacteraceae bacterium]